MPTLRTLEEAVEKYKDALMPKPFHARITPHEFGYFRAIAHKTNRRNSKEITKSIALYLAERDVVMTKDVVNDLQLNEATVLDRLNVLIQFKMLKRVEKRFYLVGPRLREFVRVYLDRL